MNKNLYKIDKLIIILKLIYKNILIRNLFKFLILKIVQIHMITNNLVIIVNMKKIKVNTKMK